MRDAAIDSPHLRSSRRVELADIIGHDERLLCESTVTSAPSPSSPKQSQSATHPG
jgi:hypothetical protein